MTNDYQITLNEAEVRLARYVGKRRGEVNRAAGVSDQRIDDTLDLDTDAFGAELALARLLNVYPDLTLSPRQGGEDLVWGGLTVDVKQTKYPDGHLLATPWKDAKASRLYALVTGTLPTYTFRGFACADDLFAAQRIKDFGRGKGYAMPQAELITHKDIRW